MKVCVTRSEIRDEVALARKKKQVVGFVPTMGALHPGHLSLLERCRKENDCCVVSIFVNPTQFNDKNDLKNYPRMPEQDLRMIESGGCNLVFMPSVEEMYPEPDTRVFDFGHLDKVMEGAHRPGHFNGVWQVVSKLFDAVMPDNAYFGQKDFQQLAIISKMSHDFNYPIKIIACPTLREMDGLAMSSRNLLLTAQQRKEAPAISKVLFKCLELYSQKSPDELKKWAIDEINKCPELEVEYLEIVNDKTLLSTRDWSEKGGKQICTAVKAGKIRLIDNVKIID